MPSKTNYRKCWICAFITLIILGLVLIIQVFFASNSLTNFLHSEITNRLVMKPSMADPSNKYHDFYNIWSDQRSEDAGISLFRYFVFNTTNPYEAANGIELPKMEKYGPFTYRRYEIKEGINFTDSDTRVKYTNKYIFEFVPDESTTEHSLNDKIYAISSQMIGFLQNTPLTVALPGIDEALTTWPAEYIYAHETIETMLTGYVDSRVEELTGILTGYNNSIAYINDDPISVEEYTGYPDNNLDKIRELIKFRGSEYQSWGQQFVDQNIWLEYVNTSRESGRQWRPESSINKNDILTIFAPEKFRKVKYLFDKETERNGLDLLRFRISDEEWYTTAIHNDSVNGRYGQSAEWGVLHDGVMRLDLTRSPGDPSNLRIPVMLSKGLFKDAPWYQQNITVPYGLGYPDEDFDEQYIEIEPVSGTSFRIINTYMISLQSNAIPAGVTLSGPSNFTNLPSLWYPQQYVSADAYAQDKTVDFFVNRLNLVNGLKKFSVIGGIILGILCFIFAGLIYYCKLKAQDKDTYNLMLSPTKHKQDTSQQYNSIKGATSPNSQEQDGNVV